MQDLAGGSLGKYLAVVDNSLRIGAAQFSCFTRLKRNLFSHHYLHYAIGFNLCLLFFNRTTAGQPIERRPICPFDCLGTALRRSTARIDKRIETGNDHQRKNRG